MKQKIKVEGKNITELFNLPCVKTIGKTDNGFVLQLDTHYPTFAYIGDWLVEDDEGKWSVEK